MRSSPIGFHRGLPFALAIAPALAVLSLVPSLAAGMGAFGLIVAFIIAPLATCIRARVRGMTIEQASTLAAISVIALFAALALAVIAMAMVYAAGMENFS